MVKSVLFKYYILHLHIRYVFEDEGLIEFGVEIFSVHLGLIFWFFVRQQIQLDKRIC